MILKELIEFSPASVFEVEIGSIRKLVFNFLGTWFCSSFDGCHVEANVPLLLKHNSKLFWGQEGFETSLIKPWSFVLVNSRVGLALTDNANGYTKYLLNVPDLCVENLPNTEVRYFLGQLNALEPFDIIGRMVAMDRNLFDTFFSKFSKK